MKDSDIDYLSRTDIPVYIWGAGEVAKLAKRAVSDAGITNAHFVLDDAYVKKQTDISKESVVSDGKPYILVRGFLESYFMTDEEIKSKWTNCQSVITISDLYEPYVVEPMPVWFYKEHRELFDNVRSNLADEQSVKAFDAFIAAKLTLSNEELLPLVERKQYFFDGAPWLYKQTDVLIEGGAYTGDSIIDYVSLIGDKYKKIIAFEPDPGNYTLLLENMEKNAIKRVEALNYGLYSEKTVLKFSSLGDMESSVSECGDISLEVWAIDDIAKHEAVSIIKMDVEGSEMDALRGAKETIAGCRPILMISAYHKRDDIYNIFNFINSLVKNYRFYFRCHKPMAIDAVLYAVPVERLK